MLTRLTSMPTTGMLEHVVQFTEARHSILAGNVANMDTPGYRVRDLSVETFQSRLKEAMEAQREPRSPGFENLFVDQASQRLRDSMKNILQHDQTDVGLEQQVTEIAKNQFMHNLAIAIMRGQFQMLEVAISERV